MESYVDENCDLMSRMKTDSVWKMLWTCLLTILDLSCYILTWYLMIAVEVFRFFLSMMWKIFGFHIFQHKCTDDQHPSLPITDDLFDHDETLIGSKNLPDCHVMSPVLYESDVEGTLSMRSDPSMDCSVFTVPNPRGYETTTPILEDSEDHGKISIGNEQDLNLDYNSQCIFPKSLSLDNVQENEAMPSRKVYHLVVTNLQSHDIIPTKYLKGEHTMSQNVEDKYGTNNELTDHDAKFPSENANKQSNVSAGNVHDVIVGADTHAESFPTMDLKSKDTVQAGTEPQDGASTPFIPEDAESCRGTENELYDHNSKSPLGNADKQSVKPAEKMPVKNLDLKDQDTVATCTEPPNPSISLTSENVKGCHSTDNKISSHDAKSPLENKNTRSTIPENEHKEHTSVIASNLQTDNAVSLTEYIKSPCNTLTDIEPQNKNSIALTAEDDTKSHETNDKLVDQDLNDLSEYIKVESVIQFINEYNYTGDDAKPRRHDVTVSTEEPHVQDSVPGGNDPKQNDSSILTSGDNSKAHNTDKEFVEYDAKSAVTTKKSSTVDVVNVHKDQDALDDINTKDHDAQFSTEDPKEKDTKPTDNGPKDLDTL